MHLALFIAATLLYSCEKTEVNPIEATQTNAQDTGTGTTPCETITFSGPNHGARITSVNTTKGPVGVIGRNPTYPTQNLATIFNTSENSAEGPDLYTNTLGNVLIVQQDPGQSAPNDNAGGATLELNFSSLGTVTLYPMNYIDVEETGGKVKFFDSSGHQIGSTVNLSTTANNGVGLVTFNGTSGISGVSKMVVTLRGSGGIDNIGFCVERPRNHCTYTYTQGYWKNHPEAWPVSSLMIGSINYTKAQLITILKTPVKGNGLISLAHQLIAAKLNIANGSSSTVIASTIRDADTLIGSRNLLTGGYLAPRQTSSLNNKLAQYIEGIIGPGHCD